MGPRRAHLGHRGRHRHSHLLHRREQGHQGREELVAVAPDAKLLGGVILVICAIGFAALWKRKRTLVAFALFLVGFAFTIFIGLAGFAFILLGGWLMLRAWRISKYGTTDSKVIRRVAATQPRGRQRKEAARSTSKAASSLRRTQASDRQQAVHPEGPGPEEDPQSDRVSNRSRV